MFQKTIHYRLSTLIICFICFSFLLSFSGCYSVPHINTSPQLDSPQIQETCRQIFPQGKWRFVHSIQVSIAGKKSRKLIGITQIDSKSKSIHCILMTIEGMVVFEAKHKKQNTTVKRSTSPFDSPHFARGLIQDVKFIFLSPRENCIKAGLTNSNDYICRYNIDSTHTKDIHVDKDRKKWSVYLYNKGNKSRVLHAKFNNATQALLKSSPPKRLSLKSYRPHNNYTLQMDLIKSKQLNTL